MATSTTAPSVTEFCTGFMWPSCVTVRSEQQHRSLCDVVLISVLMSCSRTEESICQSRFAVSQQEEVQDVHG